MACDEDFVIARDLCRNVDPECAAGCRVALEGCRAPIISQLEQCVGGCRDRLNAERAACPRRGRGRDFCIDRAQIRSFLCRDECRENLQVRAGLKSCRDSFSTCMTGCAVPTGPTPPVPTAVKTEPPPVATSTPVATETPVPTETAVPTEMPLPAQTPVPTRTPTPRPTNTSSGPR